jgi:hypothetical protein
MYACALPASSQSRNNKLTLQAVVGVGFPVVSYINSTGSQQHRVAVHRVQTILNPSVPRGNSFLYSEDAFDAGMSGGFVFYGDTAIGLILGSLTSPPNPVQGNVSCNDIRSSLSSNNCENENVPILATYTPPATNGFIKGLVLPLLREPGELMNFNTHTELD